MKFWKLAAATTALVLSTSANAAIIATSVMDDNGEWSIGNSVNQFMPSGTAGLTATAGTQVMHFNSQLGVYSSQSSISFNGVLIAAGTYTVELDVGSFDNRPLAEIDLIGMTASGTMLSPSATVNTYPAAGNWETWMFEYIVPNGSGLIDSTLGFTIDIVTNGVDANIGFDNLNIDFQAASPVPVPAAVWLFGSGLIGLVGFARRKKA